MNEPEAPQASRGLIGPPRWMDGAPSLLASGMFALAGVLLGMATFLLCVLLAVGKLPASTAIPWILALGLLAPLFLFLHFRAERYAGEPRGAASPTYLPVAPDRRWSIQKQILAGQEMGSLSKEGDGLLLRTRLVRQWVFPIGWLVCVLFNPDPEIIAIVYGLWLLDAIVSLTFRRTERIPRERIESVILCGDWIVLRLTGSAEPLVLHIGHFLRVRAKELLAPMAPFEELPRPVPPRAPASLREPRPPRPAPAPSTAIDAKKEAALDRALEGMKKLQP